MQQDLMTFPLSPQHRSKLAKAGFLTAADVLELQPLELSEELEIPKEEAFEILQTIRGNSQSSDSGKQATQSRTGSNATSTTAHDIFQKESELPPITTFCLEWDEMLGGGVPLTKITEFCGAPGIGKTQLGMQLAVNVQIPRVFQGVEGEAVYIDTEGSFIPERAAEIAAAMVKRLHDVAANVPEPEFAAAARHVTTEKVLERIHYFRVRDLFELLAVVQLLPEFCQERRNIKLVVLDSIAFHFRQDFENMAKRTRMLNGLAQDLLAVASQFELAVVLVNQMTTKVGAAPTVPGTMGGKSHLIPALGESWGHASTVRVIMFWDGPVRRAVLYKSPTRQEATVSYQVTADGIRGVASATKRQLDAEGSDGARRQP